MQLYSVARCHQPLIHDNLGAIPTSKYPYTVVSKVDSSSITRREQMGHKPQALTKGLPEQTQREHLSHHTTW